MSCFNETGSENAHCTTRALREDRSTVAQCTPIWSAAAQLALKHSLESHTDNFKTLCNRNNKNCTHYSSTPSLCQINLSPFACLAWEVRSSARSSVLAGLVRLERSSAAVVGELRL